MNTPFLNRMAAIARRGPRFFVPGHKGNPAAIPFMGAALRCDLTEVEGACDLSSPAGPLAESEANMAAVYGSGATLYSAFGSSSCIQAMLALFVGAGGRVVMARGCHLAAVRALALLDIAPTWVPLKNGLPGPAGIAAALEASGAGVVYLTSPDYYGRLADIPAIAALCQKHGARLLVDNAQGAHLKFFAAAGEGRPSLHPLDLGADACADSAHKSLPCLTPAALLHLRDETLAGAARQALNLFSSTSPSYLVLQSLDHAAGLLLDEETRPDFAAAARQLRQAAGAFPALAEPCGDPLRLLLCPAAAGLDYTAVHAALLAAGIAAEYADGSRLVLMASPWNTEADFAALEAALAGLAAQAAAGEAPAPKPAPAADGHPGHAQPAQAVPAIQAGSAPAPGAPPQNTAPVPAGPPTDLPAEPPIPPSRRTIRQALFGPRESLPAGRAAGRLMAGLHAPCPPGVPLVLPGEEISPAAAAALVAGGILQVDVVI